MRTISTSSLIALLLSLLCSTATGQQPSVLQKEKTNTTWYIYAHIPYVFYSPDKSYLETNILKGYGGGAECLFYGRKAIELDIYRYNSWANQNQGQVLETCQSWSFTPTFKLYLDSYKKLSLNIGTRFLFCHETLKDKDGEIGQKYWQNTLMLGAGYKMYFAKKNLGAEVFIGTNLLLWGNAETWTTALLGRGMTSKATIFYKLTKNKRK